MKHTPSRAANQTVSSSRTITFYVIALLIPVLFFLLFELALRAIGYGKTVPLFIDNPAHASYILPRPDIMRRYFPGNADLPSVTMEANFLLKEKPQNGYRIVVQGGSTAAGFPYGLGASIAGILDQRIRQSLAGKHVEVINTAMSAVNSYTLLDLADDVIQQRPDAVFIYAGHNEYLGILGVGSQYTAAGSGLTTRLFMRLKNWRIFQLLQHVIFALKSGDSSIELAKLDDQRALPQIMLQQNHTEPQRQTQLKQQSSRTFMAKVAKHRNIATNSEMYQAGLDQFETNMTALLAKYKSARIPVYIATIASNLKDQKPFASALSTQNDITKIEQLKQQAASLSDAELRQAITQLSLSIESASSATLHFEFANIAYQNKQYEIAKTHFLAAKEHDLLRFRAPEAINTIIRKLALQNNYVHLVEAKNALEQRSEHALIGQKYMLEHLHPNLTGYYIIANSFYEAFEKSQIVSPFKRISIGSAWQQRLVLPQEEYFGYATILNLKSDYPFSAAPNIVKLPVPGDWQQELGKLLYEKRIDWLTMMTLSLAQYRQRDQLNMAQKTLQILADAMPHNGLYNLQIAEVMFKQKRFNEALHYFKRAKLAGAIGDAIDTNIELLDKQLAVVD